MKQEIIDRIKHLEDINGCVTPEIVVNDAKNEDSPLHGEFTWDKDQAAQKQWLYEARQLIRSVKLVITTETKTISTVAYVRDPSKESGDQGYVSVEKVRNDEELSREALIMEFKRARSALDRAQKLAIAFNLENKVEQIRNDLHLLTENMHETRFNV